MGGRTAALDTPEQLAYAEREWGLDGLAPFRDVDFDDSYVYRGVDEDAADSVDAPNAHIGTSPAYHRK